MREQERLEGSVTVFFSIIFTLLLSFSLTFYQMAVETARSSFEFSAAKLAVESFFAAYHYPLYEMYHIFGREIEAGETGETFMQQLVQADLQEMTAAKKGKLSLLRRNGATIEVQDVVYLTEQKGELFFNESVNYMKYKSISSFFSLFEEQEKEVHKVEARIQFIEKKTEVDKAYAELEEDFILLMELIDGVDLEKYEKYLGSKNITFMKPYYVKYFSIYEEDEASAYFTKSDIFSAYVKHHVNPLHITKDMKTLTETWTSLRYEQMAIESQIVQVTEQIELLMIQIEKLEMEQKAKEEKTEEQQLEADLKLLKRLRKEKNDLYQQEAGVEEQIKRLKRTLQKQQDTFLKQCTEMLAICEETHCVLERMNPKLVVAKEKRKQLYGVLEGLEGLEQSEILMWQEELKEYDCYEKENAYDFEKMKATIQKNCDILTFILKNPFTEQSTCEEIEQYIAAWNNKWNTYTFEGLVLEYGDLEPAIMTLEETKQIVSKNLSENLLDLLLVEEVSKAVLHGKELPSREYDEGKQESVEISSLLQFEEIGNLLQLLQTQTGAELMEVLSSSVLFQAYLKEHFNSYLSDNGWQDSVLQYEKEYLLAGKDSDLQNLTQTVLQIILMRMALHFSSILMNTEKRETAEQAAVALAGITGMPALKYVAITIFLLIWSLEEAFVDTAALLEGKKFPIYPGLQGGCIAFSELLFFTKQMIADKVQQKNDVGTILAGYTEYIHLLLLTKGKMILCYRAMDLIQINLQKNGAENFQFKKCVCGARVKLHNAEWEYYY